MATATTGQTPTGTDDIKAKAADAADQAKEKLQDAAEQAKEQASSQAGKAKGRVRDQLDQRSTEFGQRAGSTAGDLRSVSEQLRQQGKDQPADLADQVAERIDRAASYLTDNGPDRLLSDAERVGREKPWAVIAGGLALGFAVSRLLKSSSADRYHGSSPSNGGGPGAQPAVSGRSGATTPSRPAAEYSGVESAPAGAGAASRPVSSSAASPLDDVAADAARLEPLTAPPAPATPAPVTTTTHRDRENGLGSDGLS